METEKLKKIVEESKIKYYELKSILDEREFDKLKSKLENKYFRYENSTDDGNQSFVYVFIKKIINKHLCVCDSFEYNIKSFKYEIDGEEYFEYITHKQITKEEYNKHLNLMIEIINKSN